MSDVVDSVEASFKKLVLEKPYRSITVKEICEDAFISRRTFYANFVDKRAVLAYLFRCDALNAVRRVIELLSFEEALQLAPDIIARFYQGIYDNRDFYANLVKPSRWADSTFTRVVIRAVSKVICDSVLKYNPQVDKKLLGYAADYHSAGLAYELEKWIYENYETPLEVMVDRQVRILVPSMKALVKGEQA